MLCAAPGMQGLRPCSGQGRVAELDADLADDPGVPMLELAETLRQQVYGPRPFNPARNQARTGE
jgi:hypothetical protein